MIGKALLPVLALLSVATHRSFVDTAPSPTSPPPPPPPQPQVQQQEGSPEVVPETLDANVRELESLKQSIGKTLEMMKTHASVYTNVNGHKETHSNSRSEVKEDGQLLAGLGQRIDGISNGRTEGTIRTSLDIPSKGVHKSLIEQLVPEYTEVTENGNRRSLFDGPQESNNNNQFDKIGAYAGTQYSPLDMAEYVFWTGDEKGVTMAIEEFLQEGILSREEAISFLQEIKYNLDYLQSHYTQLGLNARDRLKEKSKSSQEPKNHLVTGFRQQQSKKSAVEDIYRKVSEVPEESKVEAAVQKQEATDYDELLERLRVADFLYTEYSLEEVIYQLAKVMFTQSLTRGSAEAQQALQKFTAFLETEADQGHISRALEKKVLDVLIASLSDTLNEHPELAANNGEGGSSYGHDGQTILRQILQMNAGEKTGIVPASFKDQISRNPLEFHLQDKPHLPIGLGKYKTIR